MKIIYYCLIFLFISACQSKPINDNTATHLPESDYYKIIENYTEDAQEYDGLQNTLELSSTILNSPVLEAQAKRKATLMNWDLAQYEKELLASKLNSKTKVDFFVSFYTPDRKNTDLSRNETLWKIYLLNNGKKIEGKVSKLNLLYSEIQSLYPQFNRWSNAYIVSFPAALADIEQFDSSLVISGPLANQTLKFKSIKQ